MAGQNWMTALVMVVVVALAVTAEGQTTANCASNLIPCGNFLNSTNPPSSCCDPLRETVNNDLPCLCNLYNTPGFLESLGVNLTQALGLSRNCGITSDLSACSVGAPSPTSPNGPTRPGTPGNGAGMIQSTGLFSLVLVCASVMFF
jgi:hypothetical protein